MIPSMATMPKLGDEVMVTVPFLYFMNLCHTDTGLEQRYRPVFGARWKVQTQPDYNLHH